jgi:hypothetical protein
MSIFYQAVRAIQEFTEAGQTAQRVYLNPVDAQAVREAVTVKGEPCLAILPVDAVQAAFRAAKRPFVQWFESDEVPVGTVRVE